MKAIITMFALLLVTGAFAQKGNPTSISGNQSIKTAIKGTVSHFEGRSCDFYITAIVDGHEVKYLPTNLPSEFDIDGTKIIFDFVLTEDRIDDTCVVSAISVSNVKLQKAKQIGISK